jgi:hypothetical protein
MDEVDKCCSRSPVLAILIDSHSTLLLYATFSFLAPNALKIQLYLVGALALWIPQNFEKLLLHLLYLNNFENCDKMFFFLGTMMPAIAR